MKNILLYLVLTLLLTACGNASTPKPTGYVRIDLPEKHYRLFDSTGYPYRFDCPTYGNPVPDITSKDHEPYWLNIELPQKATIHISYKRVNKNLPALMEDTHNFVYRHVIKADAITETPFRNEAKKVYGLVYEIGGNAASSVQFYATDSTRNFFRGALYFMETPNHDFLAPMITFYTEDIIHLLETLEWK